MKVMRKMHLQAMLLDPRETYDDRFDIGLRKYLGLEVNYEQFFQNERLWLQEKKIYSLKDEFGCAYLFMRLPGMSVPRVLLIGPYMTFAIETEGIMEIAEKLAIPPWRCSRLEDYYKSIPLIQNETSVLAMVTSLGEVIWGGASEFELIDLNTDFVSVPQGLLTEHESRSTEDLMLHMKLMETHYDYENELMEMVAQGQVHRAETMVAGLLPQNFDQRLSDALRNKKNYLIISNTLLRKAAERGGVHPVFLDSLSSEYAGRIESAPSTEKAQKLLVEMVRGYSQLVRTQAMRYHSPIVQKAVICISSGLANDLSLSALAGVLNVNASYLSTLFRKEMGQTVTEYVNEVRMQNGANLLKTTQLQVQSIAQHCGISDVNYFSKLFKKYYGITPRQYRQEIQTPLK